jgi:hypothetical protein
MGRLMTAVLVAGPRAFLPPIARALQKPDVGRLEDNATGRRPPAASRGGNAAYEHLFEAHGLPADNTLGLAASLRERLSTGSGAA